MTVQEKTVHIDIPVKLTEVKIQIHPELSANCNLYTFLLSCVRSWGQ